MQFHALTLLRLALFLVPAHGICSTLTVTSTTELRTVLDGAAAGTVILLAPGVYTGGVTVRDKSGAPGNPILIAAKDPANPPIFEGGRQAIHLSDCNHVTLRGLHVRGTSINGINIDDGGSFETPSRHILVEDMLFERIGPTGNVDALKLSGVDDFVVRNCTFRGWGGSAIDMVGCHRGLVDSCTFIGLAGHDQHSGVQMKGGSTDIRVLRSTFLDAAMRAINIGGSTGLEYFRPAPQGYEAARIEVAGNRFIGGQSAIAFVTARDAHVHHNTIHRPSRWVLRILQETSSPDFMPCAGGVFEYNLVVHDSSLRTTVNIGAGTDPESFIFRHNAWFGEGVPSEPSLPVAETNPLVGVDPMLLGEGTPQLRIGSDDPRFKGIGADAFSQNE